MQRVHGHRDPTLGWRAAAVAIGNFDGVHVGHRALIARARELAGDHATAAVALTFDPHPSTLVAPTGGPPMISTLERRLELLGAAGLDATVVEPFTRELAALDPAAFVDDILIGALHARAIIVGYDFTYGAQRAGTIDTLVAHGARAGLEVAIVPPVEVAGEVASSTRIRAYLRAGELGPAARLLGRPWDVDGVVVHGAQRGRAIGVPTANLATAGDLPLAPGIYAVTFACDGITRPAVASLGTNPTFVEDGRLVLEVHVLDFDGDLYDRTARTTFVAKLRDEARYDSVDELVAQIRIDIDEARTALTAAG